MKTIVTHISPDVDALVSIWLIRRFHPDWSKAAVEFVPAGDTLDDMPPDANPNIIHVDTGLGKFDHHQDNRDTCAAREVFQFLIKKNFVKDKLVEPLERLVDVVNDIDHFREVQLPHPDADIYCFLIIDVLDGIRMKLGNGQRFVEIGEMFFDGILQTFINRVQAEQDIKQGLILQTKWGKTLAMQTENEEAMRLAQKKGFRLAIRKSPKTGHVRIKLLPQHKLGLKLVFDKLKVRDKKATWFFHKSGHMVLNGSSKNPKAVPSQLTLDEVVKIVESIK